jgi:hypothetical protein
MELDYTLKEMTFYKLILTIRNFVTMLQTIAM